MAKIFTPGATTQSIVEWVRANVATAGRLTPAGARRDSRRIRVRGRGRTHPSHARPLYARCPAATPRPTGHRPFLVVGAVCPAPTSDSTTPIGAVTQLRPACTSADALAERRTARRIAPRRVRPPARSQRPRCVDSAHGDPLGAGGARLARLCPIAYPRCRCRGVNSLLAGGDATARRGDGTRRQWWTCTSTRGASCSPGTGCRCWAAVSRRPRKRHGRSPRGRAGALSSRPR